MQDFDEFQMPRELARQLYGYSLFELNKIDEKHSKTDEPEIGSQSLDLTRNGLAVIIKQDHTNSNGHKGDLAPADSDLVFLENILKACQKKMDETLILYYDQEYKSELLLSVLEKQGISQVLMFGTQPADLELPAVFPAFQSQQLGGRKFLWAPALPLLQDKESKKTLWNSLKHFFGI